MRLCYVAPLSVHTSLWIRYFCETGHEVHVVSSGPSSDKMAGATVHRLRRYGPKTRPINYPLNSLPLLLQFRQVLRDIRPDIVHIHCVTDLALLAAASGFHPLMVSPWGSDVLVSPHQSRFSRWLASFVLRRADLITCEGEHVKTELARLGADPDKMHSVLFGVDTARFHPAPQPELRQRFGVADAPVAISIRLLNPLYDVGSFIKAMPAVLEQVPAARFVIGATGIQEQELRALAESLGVLASIKFVGWIPHDDLPQYLAMADVYVSTSTSDTTSISLLEAMACGLPVVVTDPHRSSASFVRDLENGFIVPVRDPAVLAERLITVLSDGNLRSRMSAANRQLIIEKADYLVEMERMQGLYNQMAARYPGRR